MQKHEVERIDKLKDNVMKVFVYEISQVRNMQYDINKLIQVKINFFILIPLSQKVEKVDTTQEIQDFIKENKTDRVNRKINLNK